ncbi:hypothetical protein PTTG_25712 [Puccinia triticina 1-1 BBBD Race 1]|uniref:Uncharacterized protein n=1 Tax=Puccinia triticina (isolate 1-1 / race 1 (BBBD)) TaxID=630390 RepID=A0A180H147_PUCT1|nr:hypothetical protein PTTG_25712 [Puccinia triticina 1-1 BBBD Race 1]
MAARANMVRRVSHPVLTSGPYDIMKNLGMAPSEGQFGQFTYDTTIGFTDIVTGEETNIMVKVSSYGSDATALLPDHVYILHGRFIARNEDNTPIMYFEQGITLPIGDSPTYMSSLANKVSVNGLGIVVHRQELPGIGLGNSAQTDLHTRDRVEFNMIYIIPGNKVLGQTFSLARMGKEIVIYGYICGYNNEAKTWVAKAYGVAPTSGDQQITAAPPVMRGSAANLGPRRPGLRQLGNGSTTSVASTTTPGTSKPSGGSSQTIRSQLGTGGQSTSTTLKWRYPPKTLRLPPITYLKIPTASNPPARPPSLMARNDPKEPRLIRPSMFQLLGTFTYFTLHLKKLFLLLYSHPHTQMFQVQKSAK